MAKTPKVKLPGQAQPLSASPMEQVRYQKRTSYSPEQSDHDAYCSFYDRTAGRESNETLSPAPPTRSWGSGSYDASGRPISERGRSYGSGVKTDIGTHTTGRPGKSSRPGRW